MISIDPIEKPNIFETYSKSDLEENEFFENGLKEYIWSGTLILDGGLGNKPKIQETFLPKIGQVTPLFSLLPDQEGNNFYNITFAGHEYQFFMLALNKLRELSTTQNLILFNHTNKVLSTLKLVIDNNNFELIEIEPEGFLEEGEA